MTRWMRANTAAGYLVFGLPVLLAIPALGATITRFGVWTTLTSAALPVLVVTAPLLLWNRYTRHRPARKVARLTWAAIAALTFVLLASSPLWFWTGPVLAVLLSELARALLASRTPTGVSASTIVRAQP